MMKKIDEKCQEVFLSRKENDKLKADLLLSDVREKASQLKLKQETTNDIQIDEKQHDALKKELSSLKSKLVDLNEEATTLKDKLKCMDQERARQQDHLNQFESIIKR